MSFKKQCYCQTYIKLPYLKNKLKRIRRVWWMKSIPTSKLYKCTKCYATYLIIKSINLVYTYKTGFNNFRKGFSVSDANP